LLHSPEKNRDFSRSNLITLKKLRIMKKIVFACTFFLFLVAGKVEAQKSFRFGFQTSPTFSWMRTDDKKIEGVSANLGLRLGAVGEYYFAENYAITVGLGFGFNQGGTIQNGYLSGKFWPNSELITPLQTLPNQAKLHYRINYVEIPIGLKMRSGSDGDKFRYYAEIPTINLSFLSKASGDIKGDNDLPGANQDDANDINIKKEVKKISLAWGLGGGVEYNLTGGTSLIVGLAYQQVFTDVTDNRGQVYTTETDIKKEDSKGTIRMLALRLGIAF
jgi:hypothetical protein